MNTWTNYVRFGVYYVGLVDEHGTLIREHPIGFNDVGDSARAVARLNAKEAGIAGVPAPVQPEDEARASRQARIAELRARRQSA